MTEKNRDFLKPKIGEVDPGEKRRLIDEALKRRLGATHQFYWFSLLAAKERWKNGCGISSGVFQGIRRCYTHITFHDEKPETFPDIKSVGKVEGVKKEDGSIVHSIDMFSGITEEMYKGGEIYRKPKDTETFRKPDPMDRLIPPGMPVAREVETDTTPIPDFSEED